MATIERDVSLLQRRRVAPIYIVYGSAVQIRLNMIDYTIPTNATVEFFAQCGSGPVYRCGGTAIGNSAAFTPPEGFFRKGDNALQLEINGRLIPLALDVKCEERISGVGSEETPEQVRPLVLQAQDAAKEASSAATRAAGSASAAAGSASSAAGSADSAGKSASDALQSKNAAASSASSAAGSADSAGKSANAAAESASAALGSQNAAAGSAQDALSNKNAAANSAEAAAGSASSAAGSAQEALESKNSAAVSARTAQEAMEKTQEISINPAYIGGNGNWFVWDITQGSYVDTGVKAQGPQGIPGTGNVSSVCGIVPGDDGNVPLTAENVGARPDSWMPTAQDVGAVPASALLSKTYPIGAIYLSASETSPASLFGGTWERLQGRFLLGAGDAYPAGSTGGEAVHTLTVDEMPSHSHSTDRNAGWPSHDAGSDGWSINYNKYETYPYATWHNGTENTGGSQPHNNMPPYLAVYMWKRVA